MNFAAQIINWYGKNKRDLPWRKTHDPYKIWLSEIILQQTRVEQGLSYYNKFIETFPTIHDLANAPTDRVMKLWQGLGYYSRARNLHFTAQFVSNELNGVFPETFEKLRTLKGVGDYTAAAIASFAFNKASAVVDGNVMRVITRIFGITEPINVVATKKEIIKIAEELISLDEPGLFNQAMMEFGALQCRPASPACQECCMKKICFAWQNKMVEDIPFKTKKPAVKKRYLNYLVISLNKGPKKHLYIKKRMENDIWRNLYDFPCIETIGQLEPETLILSAEWRSMFKRNKPVVNHVSEIFKHQLTHQMIYARFYEVTIKSPIVAIDHNITLITQENLKKYAIPRLIEKYLQSL